MPYPQGLDQMFLAPFSGGFATEQFNQARQTEEQARAKSLQDMMMQKEKQPFELAQMQATTRNTNATAGGQEWANKMTEATYPDQVRSKISDLASRISDNDLKMMENQIQQGLYSPDKNVRDEAMMFMQFHKDIIKERDKMQTKHGFDMELEGLRGAHAARVAQIGAASRENVANIRGPAGGKGFDPKNPQHLYAQYIHLANTTQDPVEAEKYNQLANDQLKVMVQMEALKAQAAQAGNPDLGALRRPIPTRGTPEVSPVPNRQAAPRISDMVPSETVPNGPAAKLAPAAEDWVNRAMQKNPGMSREQVIEQGKKLGKF